MISFQVVNISIRMKFFLLKQYSNIYFLFQKLQNDQINQQINMRFGSHVNEIIKQFGCKAYVNWPTQKTFATINMDLMTCCILMISSH
jgi:hypothetical protein